MAMVCHIAGDNHDWDTAALWARTWSWYGLVNMDDDAVANNVTMMARPQSTVNRQNGAVAVVGCNNKRWNARGRMVDKTIDLLLHWTKTL